MQSDCTSGVADRGRCESCAVREARWMMDLPCFRVLGDTTFLSGRKQIRPCDTHMAPCRAPAVSWPAHSLTPPVPAPAPPHVHAHPAPGPSPRQAGQARISRDGQGTTIPPAAPPPPPQGPLSCHWTQRAPSERTPAPPARRICDSREFVLAFSN